MKLSRFAKLVKQGGVLYLCHILGAGTWLGNRYAFYRANGLPETIDENTILTVLDFDTKTQEKITVREQDFDSVRDVFGLNFSDDTEPDIETKKVAVAAIYKGTYATALLCDDGELVFYDEALLSPLADVFKESEYIQTVVRVTEKGGRYIAIRDGFDTLAVILPVNIISKEYIDDLQEFETRCVEQYMREEARKIRNGALAEEVEDDQITAEETEE